ncbi:sigma-70 family RNA polymerase sigma factor [Corallincola luteus]|uniref:Sigma-70 family RNA polymerase sigma factor n=3 Tax=Psychromonadaceae TaxID=267894 RepID=A0ABY1WNH1_9GAMM|nr:sigma-70 family RNA polymerase sigma factor [Corallincola spongiicola]TCI03625.1 sigma-70 family RNA polymerase sigma factor [Corallincola luteus]
MRLIANGIRGLTMQFPAELLNRLFRYGYAFTLQRDSALDLVQQACEKVLRNPPADPLKLEIYLKVTLRNLYLDGWRKQQQYPLELFVESEHVADSEQSVEQSFINQQQLELLLPRLSPQQREVLYLWAVEGHSTSEIAAHLDEPRGTVLARLSRIRSLLSDLPRDAYGVRP